MIRSFRSKALREFFETGSPRCLSAPHTARAGRILRALDDAERPEDMNLPGLRFHPLKGADRGRYAEAMSTKPLRRGLPPMHPGELLREDVLPALGRPKAEIARLLGISRQTLYDILAEKQPVTPGMALRLGKLLGNGPTLWLNLQRRYDLWRAERELKSEIEKMPTLAALEERAS